jgi:hypothetical protein
VKGPDILMRNPELTREPFACEWQDEHTPLCTCRTSSD